MKGYAKYATLITVYHQYDIFYIISQLNIAKYQAIESFNKLNRY